MDSLLLGQKNRQIKGEFGILDYMTKWNVYEELARLDRNQLRINGTLPGVWRWFKQMA
ncbi:MAG: hypothetical protein HY835_02815 [Anaerolineae bacterium]|nr:hypothetical protein [Anaerolineae bacterium]